MIIFYMSVLETDEDKEKMEFLYGQYKNLLLFVANKRIKDRWWAEEISHQVFVSVITYIDKFDNYESAKNKNLILIVLRNKISDHYKKENKTQNVLFDDFEDLPASDSVDEHIDKLSLTETIKRLPPKLREIIELKYIYDMNNCEIAKMLNITEATLRKRLERAREKLEKDLSKGNKTIDVR